MPVIRPLTKIFWSFDFNCNDLYNVYNGQPMYGASFVSPGYTGYGSALSLIASQSQHVYVSKYLNMTYTSFTWELWAYPTNLDKPDNLFMSICDSLATDVCFHLLLRNKTVIFAFFSDDCFGSTIWNINQWYHLAVVYDYANCIQYIYLNGQLECTHGSSGPLLKNSGEIIIGAFKYSHYLAYHSYWAGYIDQVSYVSRAKTAAEILIDATLLAYYSFDNGSFYDSGPNNINGTGVNVSAVAGRINQGILFNASEAYFQANGFTLLGTSYRSFSIALWINIVGTPGDGDAAIAHLSSNLVEQPCFCTPIMVLTQSGQIGTRYYDNDSISIEVTGPILPLRTWTHVVISYNAANGIRLWVNGSFVNGSDAFTDTVFDKYKAITLGYSFAQPVCDPEFIPMEEFHATMDELRIYSRELNANDIYTLANP